MLGLDRSGCYQASIPPTAMTQPRSLLSLILRLLSLPLFNEGPEYHHGKVLELQMFVLENFDGLILNTDLFHSFAAFVVKIYEKFSLNDGF